jgi:hypothetical protein
MAQALALNPKITLNQSGYNFTRVDYISTRSILVNCRSGPLTLPETVIHRRPPCCTEIRFISHCRRSVWNADRNRLYH